MEDRFFTFSGKLRAVGDPRLNNAATLLRKVCFARGDHRQAGWTEARAFLQAYITA